MKTFQSGKQGPCSYSNGIAIRQAIGWTFHVSEFGSLLGLDISNFHHVRRIVKTIFARCWKYGVRGRSGIIWLRIRSSVGIFLIGQWNFGSMKNYKLNSTIQINEMHISELIFQFLNLMSSCFEPEGSSSGRRLYIQLRYGKLYIHQYKQSVGGTVRVDT